ncbi:hypothetical protein CA982_20385 [Gordonia lacunae]|uniref:Uncharacterized protein n=1 Tax=Gordonia lacunae TaxID=417102 RepID=A0A243Q851_9ACTN|nr:hypothetical protein CA982_20385 [Gordonia lacunae]
MVAITVGMVSPVCSVVVRRESDYRADADATGCCDPNSGPSNPGPALGCRPDRPTSVDPAQFSRDPAVGASAFCGIFPNLQQ